MKLKAPLFHSEVNNNILPQLSPVTLSGEHMYCHEIAINIMLKCNSIQYPPPLKKKTMTPEVKTSIP